MSTMITIDHKEQCSGCSACVSACPVQCITLVPDDEGFSYPIVDSDRCVGCGRCDHVCPVQNTLHDPVDSLNKTFAMRTTDESTLDRATSGGVFTGLALRLVRMGWYVCGVVYDDVLTVRHTVSNDENAVLSMAGSKYVQSDLGDCFPRIEKLLCSGEHVLFCGTPCQVAGLRGFLGWQYENLIVVDLVCHGVPSPALWKVYVASEETKHGGLRGFDFRSKHLGYHVSVAELSFGDGKRRYQSARSNPMTKAFFSNMADRPICYACPFKRRERLSDMTLFDCWHASELVSGLRDDDRGYTSVLVHTETGKAFLDMCSDSVERYEVDTERAITLDGRMMTSSVECDPRREAFFACFKEEGFEGIKGRYLRIRPHDHMIDGMKLMLRRTGILRSIKSLKERASGGK